MFTFRKRKQLLPLSNNPKVFSVTIPTNMTMEEWKEGGYSRYNHSRDVVNIQYKGKKVLFEKLNSEQIEVLNFLNDFYKTKNTSEI